MLKKAWQVQTLTLAELEQLEQDGLTVNTISDMQISIAELLVKSKLASSKRQARELITANAIKINSMVVTDEHAQLDISLFERFWIMQRGKKQFRLIKLV